MRHLQLVTPEYILSLSNHELEEYTTLDQCCSCEQLAALDESGYCDDCTEELVDE